MEGTKVISFSNQKGGVGKTSLTLHLSGVMAEHGHKVLLIDLDPQGNLSSFFINNIYGLENTIREVLLDEMDPREILTKTSFPNIDILPANITLSDLDARLAGSDDAQYLLSDSISEILPNYDYVLMDCPPSLSRATKMAFVASTHYLIPIECQEWSVKGAGQLLAFVETIKKRANSNLELLGFVINKMTGRRKIELEFNELLRSTYQDKVFTTELRNTVAFTEAITSRLPINYYSPKSTEAISFRNLFEEIRLRV
ncbi:MAG: ParA family protein [Ignavibacteriales bacterium]